MALLALQGRASERAFTVSLAFLEDNALSEPSALALSLALLALRVLGRPTDAVTNAIEKQLRITLALGNLHAAEAFGFRFGVPARPIADKQPSMVPVRAMIDRAAAELSDWMFVSSGLTLLALALITPT